MDEEFKKYYETQLNLLVAVEKRLKSIETMIGIFLILTFLTILVQACNTLLR